ILYRWLIVVFFYKKDPQIQHAFFVACGIVLYFFNYGFTIYHSLISILLAYVITNFLRGKNEAVCAAHIAFLGHLLVGYWFAETDTYDITWTTPFCIMCLRFIGLVMDVYDGQHYDSLKADQKLTAIRDPPSLLETAAFGLFFTGTLVGPQFSLARFRAFVNGDFLDEQNNFTLIDRVPGWKEFNQQTWMRPICWLTGKMIISYSMGFAFLTFGLIKTRLWYKPLFSLYGIGYILYFVAWPILFQVLKRKLPLKNLTSASIYEVPIVNTSRYPGIEIKIGTPRQLIYCEYLNVEFYGMIIVDGYDPTKSITAKNITLTDNNDFTLMEDTIYISNVPLPNYRFKFLNYGSSNKVKKRLVHGNCNLFMGRLANGTMVSPVKEMNQYLDQAILTYNIRNFTADVEMGSMTWGGVDTKNCGNFKWYDSYGESGWNLWFTGASVGNQSIPQPGYGDIYLTDAAFSAPFSLIQNLLNYGNFVYDDLRGMYSMPCSTFPKLPPITFFIEGNPITVQQDYYVTQIYDDCYINIEAQGSLPFIYSLPYYIQRYFCVAINYQSLQIGLAPVK
ncbi:unnamed protein product, partial [Mesorhabditis belari]